MKVEYTEEWFDANWMYAMFWCFSNMKEKCDLNRTYAEFRDETDMEMFKNEFK